MLPIAPDHAEPAAPEQAQREAAGARCDRSLTSLTSRSRHRRVDRLWHLSCRPRRAHLPPSGPQPRLISRTRSAEERALNYRLEAAQHVFKRSSLPSSRLRCLTLSGAASCLLCLPAGRQAAPRTAAHACRRNSLLRVNCADAAAVAAPPPHACSDFACLPVVPDKPRICTPGLSPGPSTPSPLQ